MGVRCIARREGDSLSCATANLVPFTNCRPAASPGVIASSSLYHVGSLTWPITSVGLQHCIILYKTITKIYFGHTFTT